MVLLASVPDSPPSVSGAEDGDGVTGRESSMSSKGPFGNLRCGKEDDHSALVRIYEAGIAMGRSHYQGSGAFENTESL